MQEASRDADVEVTDIKPEVFLVMLRFIYTGTLPHIDCFPRWDPTLLRLCGACWLLPAVRLVVLLSSSRAAPSATAVLHIAMPLHS